MINLTFHFKKYILNSIKTITLNTFDLVFFFLLRFDYKAHKILKFVYFSLKTGNIIL